ncbi:MAG: hypothetical protein ACP5FK_12205 [bacterium]
MTAKRLLQNFVKTKIIIVLVSSFVLFGGCLSFGEDVETTEPSPGHISKCRRLMYLRDDLEFQGEGYKITHGIDVAVWFKFSTAETSASEIFIDSIVDIWRFEDSFNLYPHQDIKWWDVKNKYLYGGVVELPQTKFMSVGMDRNPRGTTVYIFWHEI